MARSRAPERGLALLAAMGAVALAVLAVAGETPTPPTVRFTDVTATAGIDFTHRHGGTGRKYYIETVPPGSCWLDYDNDGSQDVYLVQSGPLPGTPRPPGSPHSLLYHNLG